MASETRMLALITAHILEILTYKLIDYDGVVIISLLFKTHTVFCKL